MSKRLMKQSVLKCLMFVIAISMIATLPALADEWSKTYTLSGKPDLHVETSDANIRVTTWDQNTIEAKVITEHYKIGEDGIRIEEHQSGDSVEIEVRYPHHNFVVGWSNHRVDIIVQMPREGKVTLHTGDGSIDLAKFKGEMDLNTGDGSEELNDIDGRLRATTGDGHIRANGRFDELEVKTGDGHLDVRAESGSSLSNAWRLETGDGNVSLEVPGDLAADLDLHTGDGHIDLDLPVTTDGKFRGGEIHGKLNGGGSPITIRSGDGSIRLRKS
jgi:DUF4097 and DUF4098 domain-containing protein YvlB